MNKFSFYAFLVSIGLSIILVGCGPTVGDVYVEYKPQLDAMRADLVAIADALPEKAEDIAVSGALEPAPEYNADNFGVVTNTDILMFENLSDPVLDLSTTDQFDLNFQRSILKYLRLGMPGYGVPVDQSASDEWIEKLEKALALKYLGVARVTQYEPVVGISPDEFEGGSVELDGFLVDVDSKEVLCSFSISATPNDQVNYSYQEGEDQTAALERFAHSTMWSNAREAFIDGLNTNCGGVFELD